MIQHELPDDVENQAVAVPDELNPQSWRDSKKRVVVAVVSYCDCLTFLVSMMLAPALPEVLEEFRPGRNDKALGSFCVTVYILGFAIGPLLLGPLTDVYGRTVVYRASIVAFLFLTMGCALSPSIEALIALRFFAGCAGGSPMTIGGAVVADLYAAGGPRDKPMSWYMLGTIMGPTFGPALGGVIAGKLGWRWVFWISAVLAAVAAVGLFFVLPETHVPTLERRERNRQAGKRRPRTVMVELSADSDQPEKPDLARPRSLGWVLRRAVSMPVKIAFHAHCAVVLAVICIFNGLLNMIISSLGSVYQHRYHFPPTTAGLVYLGFGIGGVAGLGMARKLSRLTIRVLHLADRGPLNVLPFLSMAFVPPLVGLLIYGWMLEYPVFWFVPLIGVFLFFLGCVSVRLSTILFLVETVPDFPASALAAHTIASSIGGSILPLATFPLYEAVGYGWGNTVIAFANVGMCLIIILMYLVLAARMYGEGWDPRVKL